MVTSLLEPRVESEPRDQAPQIVLVGSSAALRRVLNAATRIASSSAPVLLEGETGTGKELVARFIHARSRRQSQPFVAHNCAATPDSLIESELFGHARGSFTGAARDRPGLFEIAAGGTLFLDEIGDVSPLMQIKLLRVLQEREFRRLGEARVRRTDCRLIAATNKGLEDEVHAERFRADLYYRLHVVNLELPPLRARPGDVGELVDHFRQRIATEENRPPVRVKDAARNALARYPWPGNVRELENEMRRLSALWPGEEITVAQLSPRVRRALLESTTDPPPHDGALRTAIVRLERGMIADALVQAGGNKSLTARQLGLSRQGLAKKMHRYGMRWIHPKRQTEEGTGS